ncbi:NF038104 family lipoprotein [Paraneptunicella aestuarii]|uniref:NF038104 family lipoprotein n=1 Tax=Paraneptunicella aestuarii TaxID=2831148 RepID=UPI001E5EA605|nr:NF038104 family lipoprotein [Paraneptunicella aestuarii]UAA37817.1 NF038104 family lipoprotein [Paraneptunicella aestuarii]
MNKFLLLFFLMLNLSGCVAVTAVSTAVSVTTTVIGGAVDVVDAVTPDIIDDEDEEEENEEDSSDAHEN